MEKPVTLYSVVMVFGSVDGVAQVTPQNSRIISTHLDLKIAALRMADEAKSTPGSYGIAVGTKDGDEFETRGITKEENDIIVSVVNSDQNLPAMDTNWYDPSSPNTKVSKTSIDPALGNMVQKTRKAEHAIKHKSGQEVIDAIMKLRQSIQEAIRAHPDNAPEGMTGPMLEYVNKVSEMADKYMEQVTDVDQSSFAVEVDEKINPVLSDMIVAGHKCGKAIRHAKTFSGKSLEKYAAQEEAKEAISKFREAIMQSGDEPPEGATREHLEYLNLVRKTIELYAITMDD